MQNDEWILKQNNILGCMYKNFINSLMGVQ